MDTEIFSRAKEAAQKSGVRNVLVATNTGRSVETAQEIMGPAFHYFAVGNPSTSHQKGWVLHCGISPQTQARLEQRGITVVLQDVSAFHKLEANQTFHNANKPLQSRSTYGWRIHPGYNHEYLLAPRDEENAVMYSFVSKNQAGIFLATDGEVIEDDLSVLVPPEYIVEGY